MNLYDRPWWKPPVVAERTNPWFDPKDDEPDAGTPIYDELKDKFGK